SRARLAAIALALVVAGALLHRIQDSRAAQQPEGAGVVGVVQDDRGQPVADVKVTLTSPSYSSSKLTQADGRFEFRGLKPGAYRIIATLRGYEEYRNDVFISPGITTDLVIQLQAAPVIPINEKALTRYGPPNLPSKNVQAVLQDSEGWVWFGTDKGIARFNGTDFKSSSAAATPYDEVAGEDVRAIAEDAAGASPSLR